jgi:hypothetical protein
MCCESCARHGIALSDNNLGEERKGRTVQGQPLADSPALAIVGAGPKPVVFPRVGLLILTLCGTGMVECSVPVHSHHCGKHQKRTDPICHWARYPHYPEPILPLFFLLTHAYSEDQVVHRSCRGRAHRPRPGRERSSMALHACVA